MSASLAYSSYNKQPDDSENITYCGDTENLNNAKKRKPRKTYKKRHPSQKAEKFLKAMKPPLYDEEEEEDEMGEAYTQSSKSPQQEGMLQEGMEQMNTYLKDRQQNHNQYIPTYTAPTQNAPHYSQLLNSQELQNSSENDLMKKLNYIVHLLEEQHDEKTGSVTEELVLYMFLGVFVIFVVDSFSKSGKYKR